MPALVDTRLHPVAPDGSRAREAEPRERWRRATRLTLHALQLKRGGRVFGTQGERERDDILSQLDDEKRVKTNCVDESDPFLDYERHVLNPVFEQYRRWDAVVTLTCILSCVVTPANLSFGDKGVQNAPTLAFDVLVCVFMMVNLGIRCMTAVHDVHSQSFLLKKQGLRRNVLIFASSLPWFLPHCLATLFVEDADSVRQFKLLRLVDLTRLAVAAKSSFVKHLLSVHSKRVALVYRLSSISILFCMMSHWGACTVWFVGRYTEIDDASWLGQLCRQRGEDYLCIHDAWQGYMHSLSYAVSVVSTVGYSPFVGVTNEEAALAAIGSILGMFMNGYVIANILEVISESQREQRRYQTIVEKLRYYSDRYNLPSGLYNDMLGHVNYQWELHKYQDDGEILQKLSRNLRVRASLFVCGNLLTRVPIFEAAPAAMVTELVESLESCFATIDELVCVEVRGTAPSARQPASSERAHRGRSGTRCSSFPKGSSRCSTRGTDVRTTSPFSGTAATLERYRWSSQARGWPPAEPRAPATSFGLEGCASKASCTSFPSSSKRSASSQRSASGWPGGRRGNAPRRPLRCARRLASRELAQAEPRVALGFFNAHGPPREKGRTSHGAPGRDDPRRPRVHGNGTGAGGTLARRLRSHDRDPGARGAPPSPLRCSRPRRRRSDATGKRPPGQETNRPEDDADLRELCRVRRTVQQTFESGPSVVQTYTRIVRQSVRNKRPFEELLTHLSQTVHAFLVWCRANSAFNFSKDQVFALAMLYIMVDGVRQDSVDLVPKCSECAARLPPFSQIPKTVFKDKVRLITTYMKWIRIALADAARRLGTVGLARRLSEL